MTGTHRRIKRLLPCVCLLLLATALTHAKAWRGIVPLHSTRADVMRRLGKPNPRNNHHELKTQRAYIYYSDGTPCAKAPEGAWNVPRDTVVSILVRPKKKLWFSDLKLDLQKFKKVKDQELEHRTRYRNEEEGITYEVFEGGGENDGLILYIEYGPSAEDKHLQCPATVERPN